MKALAQAGGENAEYHNISQAQIDQIFERVTVSIGLQRTHNLIGVKSQENIAIIHH